MNLSLLLEAMDRYTLTILIFVGWFVCFKMFPTRIDHEVATCGVSLMDGPRTYCASSGSFEGKQLFMDNCARCHNTSLEKNGTGPALLGVRSRIPGGDWIYHWLRNSRKMIEEGDAYAVKIWKENNKAYMDPFPSMTNKEIDDIMSWIDGTVLYSVEPESAKP